MDDVVSMQRVIDMGSLVSFTGIATFKNAEEVRRTIIATPLEKIMLETDSPFLAPVPNRGKKNEPSFIQYTIKKLAEIKNENICSKVHTAELNAIFFETLEQMDCFYDPMSIYR